MRGFFKKIVFVIQNGPYFAQKHLGCLNDNRTIVLYLDFSSISFAFILFEFIYIF